MMKGICIKKQFLDCPYHKLTNILLSFTCEITDKGCSIATQAQTHWEGMNEKVKKTTHTHLYIETYNDIDVEMEMERERERKRQYEIK
jgi:hypothetical protein